VKHGVADGTHMPAEIRDRLCGNFGGDFAEKIDREFEHRAFLVDHTVELAVKAPTKMTAARQFAHILRDSCDLKRRAVDAGIVPVGVPDENGMVGRDCIEFPSRKISALHEIVEIRADYPLLFRRARGDLLQMRNELFAGRVNSSKADADDATLIERIDCATAHTSVP
jgi:hypothetical protein